MLLVATRCHADGVWWHLGYGSLYLSHLSGNGKSGGNKCCSQPNYNQPYDQYYSMMKFT